jgi:hypothetical protein
LGSEEWEAILESEGSEDEEKDLERRQQREKKKERKRVESGESKLKVKRRSRTAQCGDAIHRHRDLHHNRLRPTERIEHDRSDLLP